MREMLVKSMVIVDFFFVLFLMKGHGGIFARDVANKGLASRI